MAAHALLSPSAAHRWLNCTPSARLEEHEEDKGSAFAREGTLAHAYCATNLKTLLDLPTTSEDKEIEELRDQYFTVSMGEHVEEYVNYVWTKYQFLKKSTPDAKLLVETRLDFGEWVPESFGTADAVIIADNTIEVIDFKYGKGVMVDAEHNPQMMIYALGAWKLFDLEYDIRKVKMTIFQPRLSNISEWGIDIKQLLDWANNTLKPKADEAWQGEGHQNVGDWCRFCKVRTRCKSLATMCLQNSENHRDTRLLTDGDIAEHVLPYLAAIKTWVSTMEEYTLNRALDGVKFNGWKLVEGRSVRRIANPEAVADALQEAGYSFDSFMKPQELRTITDLEKTIGKKKFNELCSKFIEKPQGKPTLVPDSDKRPPINSAEDDFKDY